MERLRNKSVSVFAGLLVQVLTLVTHPDSIQAYPVQPAQKDDTSQSSSPVEKNRRFAVVLCLDARQTTYLQVHDQNKFMVNERLIDLEAYNGDRSFVLGLGNRGKNSVLYLHRTTDMFALPNKVGPVDLAEYGSPDNVVTRRQGVYSPGTVLLDITEESKNLDPKSLLWFCFSTPSSSLS